MENVPRILIVDDDPGVRSLFEDVLSQYGCYVTAVGAARHALLLIRDTTFDVAIVDMSLPDGDGPDVIRQILMEVPYLKVLAGSGGMVAPIRDMAMLSGATATFAKPITPENLQRAVSQLLESSCPWLRSSKQSACTAS